MLHQRTVIMVVVLEGVVAGWVGCQRTVEPTEPTTFFAHPPLYDRLGGMSGVEGLVDRWVAKVGADSRINKRFASTDLARLKKLLVEQICDAGDGPCTYKGRDMKTAHAGMRITSSEFDAMIEDLMAAMKEYKVPRQEQAELLTLLKSMREDIVEAK